jgi:hypothetical protein
VTVTASDGNGGSITDTFDIVVSNVNDAPTISGLPGTAQAVTAGSAATLLDFTVADIDSSNLTVTLTATNGEINGLTDADANATGIQVTGTAAQINTALAAATFTAVAAGSASIDVSVSDGTASATGTYNLIAAAPAPSLSTTLGGVTNLDVRSKIVLSVGEAVTAVSGKVITLTDLGGTGYQGENSTHTQAINADSDKVTIVGTGVNTKIIIDPGFDLDLAANYRLSIDPGAFLGSTSGLATVTFVDVHFSTVAPGAGFANAMQAQSMNATTGALENSLKWFDATDIGNPALASPTNLDVGTADFAAVLKGTYLTDENNTEFLGQGHMLFKNFGANDLFYVDNQDHAIADPMVSINANVFAGGVGTASDPLNMSVAGTGELGVYFVFFEIASGITLPATVSTNQLLQNVISNNWTQTGMVIAA